MSDTRTAFETALAANPDDLPTHAAYADFLIEQGDPRGDYIRLQLALEDRQQPVERLRAMEREAFALRNEHEATWLGALHEFTNPAAGASRLGVNIDVLEANVQVTYRRGWLDTVSVRFLTSQIREALANCPISRLVTALSIHGGSVVPEETLLALPNLVRLSCENVLDEPLYPSVEIPWSLDVATWSDHLPELFLVDYLRRLKYLTFRTRHFGDFELEQLLLPGLIDQLRGLDLCNCSITDDGAQALADHPAVPKLEYLYLDGNHISPIGIDALASVGVEISQRQHLGPTPGEEQTDDPGIVF